MSYCNSFYIELVKTSWTYSTITYKKQKLIVQYFNCACKWKKGGRGYFCTDITLGYIYWRGKTAISRENRGKWLEFLSCQQSNNRILEQNYVLNEKNEKKIYKDPDKKNILSIYNWPRLIGQTVRVMILPWYYLPPLMSFKVSEMAAIKCCYDTLKCLIVP